MNIAKRAKKILSIYCALAVTASLGVPVVSAADTVDDVLNPAELLNNIGISAVYDEESFVTRGDFAVLAVQATNDYTLYEGDYFTDVSGEQGKFINTAAQMGIVSVNSEKLFYPDRIISYEEALTICVRMLGYTNVMADKSFPNGYVSQATKLGLTRGVTADKDISGADAATLLFNMLNTKYIEEIYTASKENAAYKISDQTYLETCFAVYKMKKGPVSSVCGLTLNGKTPADSDHIVINNVIYKNPHYSNVNNYTLLGHEVSYYVRIADGYDEVVYIKDNSETIALYPGELESVVGFDSGDSPLYRSRPVLTYITESGTTKRLRIDALASVFINATASVALTNNDFFPDAGRIYLTDSNDDGAYDVISIEKYTYYLVTAYDKEGGVISGKDVSQAFRMKKFEEGKLVMEHEGKPIPEDFITQGTVFEIMCSYKADNTIDYEKFARVSLAPEKITGAITGIDDGRYIIGDKTYGVMSNIKDSIRSIMGKEMVYYIGSGGVIVAYESVPFNDNMSYGYIVRIFPDDGVKERCSIKLFTLKGTFEYHDTAEEVRFSGFVGGSYSNRRKVKTEDMPTTLPTKELVRYKVNQQNEITEIVQAHDHSGDNKYVGFDEANFSLDSREANYDLSKSSGLLSNGHRLNTETICVFVSGDGSAEGDFAIGAYNLRGGLTGISIKVYDSKKNLVPAVAVIENAPTRDNVAGESYFTKNKIYLVSKKSTIINEDGELQTQLDLAQGTSRQKLVATDDNLSPLNDVYHNVPTTRTKFSDLRRGDVISIQLNAAGKISGYVVLNDYDTSHTNKYSEKYAKYNNVDWLASCWRVCGNITRFTPQSSMTIDASGNQRLASGLGNTTFMIFNLADGSVQAPGSNTVLSEGDYVWVYAYRTEARMVVKYVNE